MKIKSCNQPTGQTVLNLSGGNINGSTLDSNCLASTNSDFRTRDAIPQYDTSCSSKNTWGPWPNVDNFKSPSIPVNCDQTNWAHKRILEVIDNYVNRGYNYCHHHVGTWMPPNDSTNRAVINICPAGDPTASSGTCSSGRSGVWNGIDCTTYTSWAYLYGFGMYLVTNTASQACGPNSPGKVLPYTRDQQDQFQPGDIIYLGNSNQSKMVHGILWTGIKADQLNKDSVPFGINTLLNNVPSCQQNAAKKYLQANAGKDIYVISDSHWNGPNYRPFAGWYYDAFSHAKRLINPDSSLPQNSNPTPSYCSSN